jgi:polyketide biosynthesis enoyl-CoA hydratase PksH
LVLEGSPEVFCFGADFSEVGAAADGPPAQSSTAEPLYELWQQLATGPWITIAHVRGKANAGGVGFAAACDLVLADRTAVFSLSELLFGLFPACVLPFLIRRIGRQRAHYMTISTQPVSADQALNWGLIDACEADSESLLRRHLLRMRRLSRSGLQRYRRYLNELDDSLAQAKPLALAANREIFSDRENLDKIARYAKTGQFPWET